MLVLSAGFVGIVLWGAYSAVDRLSAEVIERASTETQAKLEGFFKPVERTLNTALDWGRSGTLDPRDVKGMNRRFIPVLEHLPQVSSMLVATPDGV